MALFCRKLLAVFIAFFFEAPWGQCLTVEFYREQNYTGFIPQMPIYREQELQCINLHYKNVSVKSIKTDKCLILYASQNCRRLNVGKYRLNPDEMFNFRIDGNSPSISAKRFVNSFHVCDSKLGGDGPQLDLDIYKEKMLHDDKDNYDFELYAPTKFRDACGCQNVSSGLAEEDGTVFVDNHGNSVNLYGKENCQGEPRHFPPELSHYNSLNINYLKSFKAADSSGCYRLTAKIFKFNFQIGTQSLQGLATEKVPLSADAHIRNTGAFEITQTLRVNSKITETVEFSVAKAFYKMDSAGVEANVELTTEIRVPLVASAEMKASLVANYRWNKTEGNETKNSSTVSKEEAVEIEREIKIPPCKACKITSHKEKILDFPIKYTVHSKVSATEGADSLSTDELRKLLPAGMDYVKSINRHTIEAVTNGTMYMSFDRKASIDVNCEEKLIYKCVPPSDIIHSSGSSLYATGKRISVLLAVVQILFYFFIQYFK